MTKNRDDNSGLFYCELTNDSFFITISDLNSTNEIKNEHL